MKKLIALLALAAMSTQAQTAEQGEKFLQLSLTPDIALHSNEATIRGLSIGIWSENPQHSLTLGIVNGSTGDSSGLSLGPVNYTESYTGVQLAIVNLSKSGFTGWQAGVFNYAEGTFTGVQTGFLNYGQELTGLQCGAVNCVESLNGVQIGIFNVAVNDACKGLQLGAVNCAEILDGVQIGFLNVAMNNGWFGAFPDKLATVFPFVNWSF